MVDLDVSSELCCKAAVETDLEKLELVKQQMKILLSNHDNVARHLSKPDPRMV